MTIFVKNKHELQIDGFRLKCCIGKNGTSKRKIEGDYKTPIGIFDLGNMYYRSDRIEKPVSKIKICKIKKNMGWCDDPKSKNYNKLIKIKKNFKSSYEKLYRKDSKYDLFMLIKYNYKKVKKNKGSAIFLHLTNDYSTTKGCVAIKKKDFLILNKLINKKTKIKIT